MYIVIAWWLQAIQSDKQVLLRPDVTGDPGHRVLHAQKEVTYTHHQLLALCVNNTRTVCEHHCNKESVAMLAPPTTLLPFPTMQILGLGRGCSSATLECDGFSFLPSFEVNSTVYSTITDMHSLARGIMSVACNLEESVIGYRDANLRGVPGRGGPSVHKICVRESNTSTCPRCDDHLNNQCKL